MIVNVEVEARLLGTCLKSIDWVNKSVPALTPSHFKCPKNREIWSRINDLYKRDCRVDLEAIESIIDDKVCPVNYLVDVYSIGSTSLDIQQLLDSIKETHRKSQLYDIGNDLSRESENPKIFSAESIKTVEERFFRISQDTDKKIIKNIPESVDDPKKFLSALQERQELFKKGINPFEGIPTHYTKLDECLKGFCAGHLTLVGARPGMGKTTFALNLAERIVKESKEGVLFFSLEMPAKELAEKLICMGAAVSFQKYKQGSLSSDEYQRIVVSYHYWNTQNFYIDDQPSLNIHDLHSRASRYKKTHNISCVFIDYVQLVTSKSHEARYLEIGDISRKLKEMAKTLEIPVIALAQLNRDTEKRDNKKPFISDLRESGSLEADADEIILLHRPEVYDPYEKPGLIQVFVAKNRFGPQSNFELAFIKETGKIENYAFTNQRSSDVPNPISQERNPHKDFFESLC